MAHGDYYNPANKSVTDGTVVYADDVNKINTAVDSALEQVAYDLDVLEASLEAGGLSAKNWATEDQGTRPDPILDLYSAKAYALEAKDWASASGTITEASTGVALAGSASAKTKAAEAATSALDASRSASFAAGSAITATNKAGEALSSANAAALSETNAGNSAISAAASAAKLPNATTAGASKLITTNISGSGWEYPLITAAGKAILDDVSAEAQRRTLGLGNVVNVDTTNANNITSGTLAEARIPSTIARGSEVAALDSKMAALFSSRSRKNLLINGGFDVWQDGPGPFTTDGYCADGWYFRNLVLSGNSANRADFGPIEVATPRSPKYCLNLTAAPGSGCSASARIEYLPQFSGKTLTCSFWTTRLTGSGELDVQLNSNFGTGGTPTTTFRPVASSPGGVIFPVTTTFERRTATFTVPDLSSYTLGTTEGTSYLELEFSFLNIEASSSICAIADVQFEFGDTATDFEYRHPAEELALCQRYYETGTDSIRKIFYQLTSTSARSQAVPYKVTKRVTPAIVVGSFTSEGHTGTPGVLTAASTEDEFVAIAGWTGGTVGRAFSGLFTWAADARL